MDGLLFDDFRTIGRTILVGVCAYAALILLLRASGKRTLSKLNAFDLIVTVALGSVVGNILLDQKTSLAEGLTAIAVLIGLQLSITWWSVRRPWVRQLVTGEPSLLAFRGALLPEALRRNRVAPEEVRAALRQGGLAGLGAAEAVVLETDGSISVVARDSGRGPSSLEGLDLPPQDGEARDRQASATP